LNGTALAAPTKNSHEQAHTLQKKNIYNIIWKDVAGWLQYEKIGE